jgi:uroporphyrinogen-III synthase
MPQQKISILSTRPLNDSLIHEANQKGIVVDVVSFIETAPVQTIEVRQEIENILLQSATVVFTSTKAVEAVAAQLEGHEPDWLIYSIGNHTGELVQHYFGAEKIAGTGFTGKELANIIIEESDADEIFFFCGNRRRDELPDILKTNNFEVNEIVVYETISIPQKITKEYNGVLFFSPSAVESFFQNNKINNQTILFAIGNTTADEIKKFSGNKIIISDEPSKELLMEKVMEYFG